MSRSSRDKLLLALLLAGGLAVAVALIGVEVPGLGAEVAGLAAERAIRLDGGSFHLDLRRGLVARDVEASTDVNGDRLVARIPRMTLGCRLGPLLGGDLVVREIGLEGPSIEILSRSPGSGSSPGLSTPGEVSAAPPAGAQGGAARGRVRLELDRVWLSDGQVVSRMADGSGGTSEVRGLDLELVEPRLESAGGVGLGALSANGRLTASELSIDRYRLTDIAAPLAVERGRFRLDPFESWSAAMRISVAELEVDLAQFPYRYRVDLTASRVDLGDLLDVREGAGEEAGSMVVEVSGFGEGPGLPGAVAEMSVELAAGALPPLALLQRIDDALGTNLVGAAYERSRAEISLTGGKLLVEPFEVATPGLRFSVGGSLVPGGDVSLEVTVQIPDDVGTLGLSAAAVEALSDRGGWIRLPISVRGPLARPRLGLDEATLAELLERRGVTAPAAMAVRSELRRLLNVR